MRALSLSRTIDEIERRFNFDSFKIGALEIGILVARIVKLNNELSGSLTRPCGIELNSRAKRALKSFCGRDYWSYAVRPLVGEHSK